VLCGVVLIVLFPELVEKHLACPQAAARDEEARSIPQVRSKNAFLTNAPFYTNKTPNICQDRLGTSIRRTHTAGIVFAASLSQRYINYHLLSLARARGHIALVIDEARSRLLSIAKQGAPPLASREFVAQ
jgi:hypothetical protein